MNFGKSSDYSVNQLLRNSFGIFYFLIWLGTSSKRPSSRSFRLETSTHGLARSGGRDNRKTCHITVHCFSLENVVYLWEYTNQSFYINKDCIAP